MSVVVRCRNSGLTECLPSLGGCWPWEHLAPGWMDLASLSRASHGLAGQQPWPGSSTAGVLTPARGHELGSPRTAPAPSRSSSNREMTRVTQLSCGTNEKKKMLKKKASVWIHVHTRWQYGGIPILRHLLLLSPCLRKMASAVSRKGPGCWVCL